MFPFANGTTRKILRLSIGATVSVLLIEFLSLCSSIIYTYKCKTASHNRSFIECSSFAINQVLGFGSTFYTLIVAYITRDKIRNMLDRVQEIYDGSYT